MDRSLVHAKQSRAGCAQLSRGDRSQVGVWVCADVARGANDAPRRIRRLIGRINERAP
jgi:hypothetical protein